MEEGIVRFEHSGVFGVHEHRLEVRDKRTENSRKGFEQLRGNGLGTCAVAPAHGPGTEGSGGPGFVGTSIKDVDE